MRVVLFCATRRGWRVLLKMIELAPQADLRVFSFKEDAWEPPFLDDIRRLAEGHGAEFYETKQAGGEKWQHLWDDVDLILAVNWRYIIPARVFERARLGAYVFHDSLLPAYRGFSPTVWALINGEDHTGVTLFEMVEDYDAGAIIGQARVPVSPDATIATVTEQVTDAYLALLETHLSALTTGNAPRRPQDDAQATYTCKLLPEDFRIDWSWPTARIYNLIRAVTAPYAGAYTTLNGQKLIVWSAQRVPDERRYVGRIPGRVIDIRAGEGVTILTGDGMLRLTRVQLEGQEAAAADSVLNKISFTLR
ncbi:MAG: methionyl-tRNA formyltransferase-like protein [Anaerolineae bacterium]|nr:methionyl-tRNA formyltransferase-like protein [Anaerolineae bacterium]